jgi:Gpi18-like mannosyltransferase
MSARRLLLAGLLAGCVLRALILPLPGTGDVVIWKVWSFAGANDLTAMYGIGGTPPEHRLLHWQGEAMTVDYPPLSLAELAIAGRLYRLIRPEFQDGRLLNIAVKLPGLGAELAWLAWLWFIGRRALGDAAAAWAMLATWLNPAILIDGSTLGYLDMQMAVPLLLAVIAAVRKRSGLAGVLIAIAVLTKAQALFAAPAVIAIVAWHRTPRWRALAETALAGALTTAVVVMPFAARGAWSNLTQALSRLAVHDMLSAQAANAWWIFTWILRVIDVGPEWGWWRALTQEVRILAISRSIALGYPNARTAGLMVVAVCLAWVCLRMRRGVSVATASACAAWSMYAYALFAAQVHENHLAPAVLLLVPAAACERRYRGVFWTLTGIVSLNLYLFYGLGDGWPSLIPRSATIVDASVVLAFISLITFAWFTQVVGRATSASR